ncbi:MAG: ABC transporter permease, partial [Bryobacteraceae bacterium]
MPWIQKLSNLFRRRTLHTDLDEELQFHLDARTRDNLAAGMTTEDARRDANRRFGNRTGALERTRDADLATSLESIGQDLGYALRWLRQSPGFTAVALIVLALGIGANTAVFTVVNGVLLQPLPFPESDRLVLVSKLPKDHRYPSGPSLIDRDYIEFRQHADALERVATYGPMQVTLSGTGDPLRLPAAEVTSGFFDVLRVEASLGRTFLPEDVNRAAGPVVVLSDALWRRRFGGSPAILGQQALINGVGHTVVGVVPAGMALPANAELWIPFEVQTRPNIVSARPVVGRLKPGVSMEQAAAALTSFVAGLPSEPGTEKTEYISRLIPLKEWIVGDVRKSLLVFAAAVAFVLLIACANVANLLLIRAAARRQEISVRAALGASRWRLIRQLLTESTLVSLGGGALGILVAIVAVPALLALAPSGKIPRADQIHVDAGVLAFTLGISLATGLLFGLVPAFQATRRELRETLGEGSKTSGRGQEAIRAGLAVLEIALALVLLTGAGLMVRSFLRLRAVDPGFQSANLLTVEVNLPSFRYKTAAQMQTFHDLTLDRIARLPGVVSAAAVNWMPLGESLIQGDFVIEGGRTLPAQYTVAKPGVSAGYHHTMGIRLIGGREFDRRDSADAPGVVIISQSVARTLWPAENPVGKRISMEEKPGPGDWLTIIGVVVDVLQ